MPDIKAIAVIDGKDVEVTLKDAPKGFLSEDQHGVRLEQEVTRRVAGAKRTARTEFLEDAEFRTEALVAWKDHLPKPKDGKPDGESVARLQEELREREVKPLNEKLTSAQQRIDKILTRQLEAELTTALIEAGAKKSVAAKLAKLEAAKFGFEEKSEMFAVRKGKDEFEFSGKATSERPWKGIAEFATEWAANKENTDWLDPQRQAGPGLGRTGSGGADDLSKLSPEQRLTEARKRNITS